MEILISLLVAGTDSMEVEVCRRIIATNFPLSIVHTSGDVDGVSSRNGKNRTLSPKGHFAHPRNCKISPKGGRNTLTAIYKL